MGTINDFATFAFFLQGYQPANQDQHSSNTLITYYGFVNQEGAWYIQEETKNSASTSFEWKFLKGTSDFATTYANRQGETYDTWPNTFKGG